MRPNNKSSEPQSPQSQRLGDASRLGTAGLYGLSGVLLGAALSSPSFAACAWLSVGVYAVAMRRTTSSFAAGGATLLAHALACVIAFPWMLDGNYLVFDYTVIEMIALCFGEAMLLSVPYALVFGLAHALLHGRLATRLWIPVVWAGGEALSYATGNAAVDDWLNTQWTVEPVLRALALVGWWPLVLACLFASASVGEAFASRRWRLALPSVAIITAIMCAPRIRDGKEARLEGIAAIHSDSMVALPWSVPADIDLLVWPETAIDLEPTLTEGPGNGVQLPSLLPDSRADHLIGLRTVLPRGLVQNQAVAVSAEGRVIESRAKQVFLPLAERRFLGFGRTPYLPGTRRGPLTVGARAIVSLICSEGLSRGLLADGVAAGGEMFTVLAGDEWLASERAYQQFLAIQVLRSVEFEVPSVRASYKGVATFVAADGRVLAQSRDDRNGVLLWDRARGARDLDFRGREIEDEPPADAPADVAVLYSESAPKLRTRCPEGRCDYYALESLECDDDARAATVIVAGHGRPPEYLSRPAAEIAAAIRCFEPELLIVDTCFGASSELLAALGDLDVVVVAAASLVANSGFRYGSNFFTAEDPRVRAAAVNTFPESELLRWRNDPAQLARLLAEVEAMGSRELGERLVRRRPPTVKIELPSGGPMLIPIAWERLESTPLPTRLSSRTHRARPHRVGMADARPTRPTKD